MSAAKTRWFLPGTRLACLVVAAAACVFAFSRAPATSRRDGVYACPMHPGVTATAPGECPICRMALERVQGREAPREVSSAGPSPSASSVSLSPDAPDIARHDLAIVRRMRPHRRVDGAGWVEETGILGRFYQEEAAALQPGDRGTFTPSGPGRRAVEVRLLGGARADADSPRVTLRFEVTFDGGAIDACGQDGGAPGDGEVGWLDLGERTLEVLVVPAQSVIESPEGPFVMIASDDGRSFPRRGVRLGRTFDGLAVVQGGPEEGQQVVTMGAFLLDAERRLVMQREALVDTSGP